MEAEMEEEIARHFKARIVALLDSEEDITELFRALREYHADLSVDRLVAGLRRVVTHPSRLGLFDEVRPLVPVKHQLEYDAKAPRPPSRTLKVIYLRKGKAPAPPAPREPYGFSVRGGFEYGIGVYCAQVAPDSAAWLAGLRVGDHIYSVNGYSLDESTHEEAIQLMSNKSELVLKVRSLGMVPTKELRGSRLVWKFVEGVPEGRGQGLVRVVINVVPGCTLGLALNTEGCVQQIRPGSLGEEVGIEPGDIIVQCNKQTVPDMTQEDVTALLSRSRRLDLYIKRAGAGQDNHITSDTRL